jgi:hypothetical protein
MILVLAFVFWYLVFLLYHTVVSNIFLIPVACIDFWAGFVFFAMIVNALIKLLGEWAKKMKERSETCA